MNPTKEKALELADALQYIKKYKKAISYYEFALAISPLNEKQTANYFNSLFEYGDYKTSFSVAQNYKLRFGSNKFLAKLDSFEKLSKNDNVNVENYAIINSPNNEYGLFPLFADYKIVNSDVIVNNNSLYTSDNNLNKFIKPYIVSLVDTSTTTPNFYPLFENSNMNNIISYYDETEKKIYITRSNENKFSYRKNMNKNTTMKIFISNIDAFFKISEPVEFQYNSEDYSCGQACVSKDGQMLYFVSDMPGGYGGSDIYRCMKLEDGTWGKPINLGTNVNTSGDEMFPAISPSGNMLYYSSTGHSIFGGMDIVKSSRTRANVFGKPINLGAPYNSNKDDFAIVFTDKEGKRGYFSSNRTDGLGGDDIYHFKFETAEEKTKQQEIEKIKSDPPALNPTKLQVED